MRLSDLYILLVEPSKMQRQLIERHLRGFGISSIKSCDSGAQALEIAAEDPPDLVISSLHLAGISGAELLARMREDARGCRFAGYRLCADLQ